MKEGRGSVINMDFVVNTCLADKSEFTTHNYQQLLHWGSLGVIQLNLYVINNIKVAYLPINTTNFTVDLPIDYVDYTKVSVCQCGRAVTLGLNNNLCLPRKTDACGEPLSSVMQSVNSCESDCGCGCNNSGSCGCCSGGFGSGLGGLPSSSLYGFYFINHYRGGQYVGEYFSVGGGFAQSYYRIDKERAQIVLSNEVVGDEIMLEYISSGVEVDGSSIIPIQALEALRAYIHWQAVKFNKRASQGSKDALSIEYKHELNKLRAFELSFTKQEVLDTIYKTYKLGPKR